MTHLCATPSTNPPHTCPACCALFAAVEAKWSNARGR